MTTEESAKHAYLGDAVYAYHDGSGIWLRTGDHRDYLADNRIYLEESVIRKLMEFYDKHCLLKKND